MKQQQVKKILVVRNNPRDLSKSNLHKLETYLLEQVEGQDVEVQFHDLYRKGFLPRLDREFLEFLLTTDKSVFGHKFDREYRIREMIARDFAGADLVVIVSPYWTGLFPSALKDGMDLLPMPNVTLFTSSDGKSQKGKDTGKLVLLLQTSGDTDERNRITNIGVHLVKNVMHYYGVHNDHFAHIMSNSSYLAHYDDTNCKQAIKSYMQNFIRSNHD